MVSSISTHRSVDRREPHCTYSESSRGTAQLLGVASEVPTAWSLWLSFNKALIGEPAWMLKADRPDAEAGHKARPDVDEA